MKKTVDDRVPGSARNLALFVLQREEKKGVLSDCRPSNLWQWNFNRKRLKNVLQYLYIIYTSPLPQSIKLRSLPANCTLALFPLLFSLQKLRSIVFSFLNSSSASPRHSFCPPRLFSLRIPPHQDSSISQILAGKDRRGGKKRWEDHRGALNERCAQGGLFLNYTPHNRAAR